MSTTNFNWTVTMTDGSTQIISASIENLIFSGDDISNCILSLEDTNSKINTSLPLTYFLGKIYSDENIIGTAGNLINSLVGNSKINFEKYYSGDVSSISNSQWISLLSNSNIIVTPTSAPSVDSFTGHEGKYTFSVSNGTNSTDSFVIQIPQINYNGSITNNTYTLSSGDTLTIFGTTYNGVFAYTILSKQIKSESNNIVVTGDISASGASKVLSLPDIGVAFTFNRTGTGVYNCVVSSIASSLSNVDLRRYSIWNGGSVETYTINDGTLTSAGTNIDSTIYGDSQDVSTVLICVNSIVWKITYWSSAKASRFRVMAERTFI